MKSQLQDHTLSRAELQARRKRAGIDCAIVLAIAASVALVGYLQNGLTGAFVGACGAVIATGISTLLGYFPGSS